MEFSPKIAYGLSVFSLTVGIVLIIVNREAFISGLFVGISFTLAFFWALLGVVRQKLEVKMNDAQEQIGEALGIDINAFLGKD